MRSRLAMLMIWAGLLAGCGGSLSVLTMAPLSPAYVDESSVSPSLRSDSFSRVMIVPPSGTGGVQFEENLAAIERSFIARGVTVISSAITSRVILDEPGNRQRGESGLQLSEVERALVLARESNVDAVLQIGAWDWIEQDRSENGRRYFVHDKEAKSFREVDRIAYEQSAGSNVVRRSFGGQVLAFTGRLIDVENGEVVASFKIDVPKVNLGDVLTVSYDGDGNVVSESYSWSDDERKDQAATNRAVSQLFDRLASLISNPGK